MKTEDYGQYTQPNEIRFVRLLPGPIERVWAYLTEPEKRATWLARGPMELKAGGSVELQFHHADFATDEVPAKYKGLETGHGFLGRITRCEPPRLLAFTWPEEDAEDTEVVFELSPHGQDVQLILTHLRLPNRSYTRGVSGGWHSHLDVLQAQIVGGQIPPFWSRLLEREEEYEKRLDAYFSGGPKTSG